MMVRRAFLVGMNYFDERFGQFGPLMELCFQIRGANKSILMLPGVRVQRAPIREEDDASYAADRVHGAATYISKHFGSGAAIGFRMKAILSTLARIFTFRDVGYDFQRLTGLLGGQKIDGNQ